MQLYSPQINPIFRKGKKNAAVLLLHGFTGTPDSMRTLANHLHHLGFTVSAPLLAGHGTTRENLARSNWKSWYKTAETAFIELSKNHEKVFVAGLSMGGVLALKLAQDHSEKVTGLSCLATPIFLASWVRILLPIISLSPLALVYKYQPKSNPDVKDPIAAKNYWSINDMPLSCINSLIDLQTIVRSRLDKIKTPTLLIHSRYDSTAPYESLGYITKHISSPITESLTLENSFHLITIDYEKDLVAEKTGEFFLRFA